MPDPTAIPVGPVPAPAATIAPSSTLAMAGLALLLFPRAVKTVAYAALGVYGFQLVKLYRTKGVEAVATAAKQAVTGAQTQIADLQKQELQAFVAQAASSLPGDQVTVPKIIA